MTTCLIALGANISASEELFDAALRELDGPQITVCRKSSVFRTAAVGADAGGDFLNAVATVETRLDATDLLARLHRVENHFGRVRTIHWGPRRLDLDLILFEDQIISRPDLEVPHPACWYRRFVLEPAVQVAPQMVHPLLGETIGQLMNELRVRPLHVELEVRSASIDSEAFQQQLIGLEPQSPAIVWHLGSEQRSNSVPSLFARLILNTKSGDSSLSGDVNWSQPRNEIGRTVVIKTHCLEQAVDQVQLFRSAVLGS